MKHLTATVIVFASWVGTSMANQCSATDSKECEINFKVEASFVQGQYGQAWKVIYDGGEEVEIEITNGPPRYGTISGKIRLAADDRERLQKEVARQRFFELSEHIAAGYPMHQPDLRLRITLSDKRHEVQLYAPRLARTHKEAPRFLAVWDELFKLLPVRPSWN